MDALAGITVLDLTAGIAGPYATKLLADLGARVIKIERPGGDPARTLPPFLGDEPGPERSATFHFLNTNKQSVVLDLTTTSGKQALYGLLPLADLVVTSSSPATAERLGIDAATLRARRDLPVLAITNFGQTGPYRDYRLSETVLYAMGGEMYSHGTADREPLKLGGTAALLQCGAMATVAALGALHIWETAGTGQSIDLALFEAQIASLDRRSSTILAYRFSGRVQERAAGGGGGLASGIYPVADGYVEVTAASGDYWARFVEMLDDNRLRQPRWSSPLTARDPAAKEEVDAIVYPWMLARTRAEVWEAARRARAMVAPLYTGADLYADAVLHERGLWAEAEHALLGRLPMLGRPYLLEQSPWRLRHPAPRLGEHTGVVLGAPPPPARPPETPDQAMPLPLANVRICDFTAVWAGQSATMYLADMGAECIKVENPTVWNPMTRAAAPVLPAAMAAMMPPWMGGHPGGDPGPRPWNNCPAFVHVQRNKRSITVDSRRPEGLALVEELIRVSDVLAENLATGTLEKLGLTDDRLRELRPDLIILHLPAFGRSGPYTAGRGYGSHIDAVAGGTILRGYADTAPYSNTQIFAGDYFVGLHGAVAVMAALRHRRRTGAGQVIELAQWECSAQMFPQAALDAAWNGRAQRATGNRSAEGYIPNGVFPCAGADRWLALSCRNDGEWAALVAAMGRPGWALDAAFATAAGRAAAEGLIEQQIAAWTAKQERDALFHRLQTAGVTAGPVLNAADAATDPQLAANGAWQTLPATDDYPETPFQRPPYRFSRSDIRIRTAPAPFGADTAAVYRDLLGLGDKQMDRLRASGHITNRYAENVLGR